MDAIENANGENGNGQDSPIAPKNPAIRWAVDAFKTKKAGDEITPDDVFAIIKMDCTGSGTEGWDTFYQARLKLGRAPHYLQLGWNRKRKVFWVLEDAEIISSLIPSKLKALRRRNREAQDALCAIDMENLDQEQKSVVEVQKITSVLLDRVTSRKMQKQLSNKVAEQNTLGVPDADKLIEFMGGRPK